MARVKTTAIASKRDFVGTDDGLVCVSQRLRDLLLGLTDNCRFHEFDDTDYSVLLPSVVLPADDSGLERKRSCSVCGRYGEIVGLSFLGIVEELPALEIGCPDVSFESGLGRCFWYFVDDALKRALAGSAMTGIEFMRM